MLAQLLAELNIEQAIVGDERLIALRRTVGSNNQCLPCPRWFHRRRRWRKIIASQDFVAFYAVKGRYSESQADMSMERL